MGIIKSDRINIDSSQVNLSQEGAIRMLKYLKRFQDAEGVDECGRAWNLEYDRLGTPSILRVDYDTTKDQSLRNTDHAHLQDHLDEVGIRINIKNMEIQMSEDLSPGCFTSADFDWNFESERGSTTYTCNLFREENPYLQKAKFKNLETIAGVALDDLGKQETVGKPVLGSHTARAIGGNQPVGQAASTPPRQ